MDRASSGVLLLARLTICVRPSRLAVCLLQFIASFIYSVHYNRRDIYVQTRTIVLRIRPLLRSRTSSSCFHPSVYGATAPQTSPFIPIFSSSSPFSVSYSLITETLYPVQEFVHFFVWFLLLPRCRCRGLLLYTLFTL